jgi:hypothetical protein
VSQPLRDKSGGLCLLERQFRGAMDHVAGFDALSDEILVRNECVFRPVMP